MIMKEKKWGWNGNTMNILHNIYTKYSNITICNDKNAIQMCSGSSHTYHIPLLLSY